MGDDDVEVVKEDDPEINIETKEEYKASESSEDKYKSDPPETDYEEPS